MRVVVLLLALMFSAGCIDELMGEFGPVRTHDWGTCPAIPTTQVVIGVIGTDEPLRRVRLLASHGEVYPMLSCIGPSGEHEFASDNGVTVKGMVDRQRYQELTLFFAQSVFRIQALLELEQNGTLVVDLGNEGPRLQWRDRDVRTDRHERLTPATALDPFIVSWSRPFRQAVDENITFHVNTSWNRGVHGQLYSFDERQDVQVYPWMEVELVAPNGTSQKFAQGNDYYSSVAIGAPALEPGQWRLRIRTGDPEANPLRLEFGLTFRY